MSIFNFILCVFITIVVLSIAIPLCIVKFANVKAGNKVIDFLLDNTWMYAIMMVMFTALVTIGICSYFKAECTSEASTHMMVISDNQSLDFPTDGSTVQIKVLNSDGTDTVKTIKNPVYVVDIESYIEEYEVKQTFGFLYNYQYTYIVHVNYGE